MAIFRRQFYRYAVDTRGEKSKGRTVLYPFIAIAKPYKQNITRLNSPLSRCLCRSHSYWFHRNVDDTSQNGSVTRHRCLVVCKQHNENKRSVDSMATLPARRAAVCQQTNNLITLTALQESDTMTSRWNHFQQYDVRSSVTRNRTQRRT